MDKNDREDIRKGVAGGNSYLQNLSLFLGSREEENQMLRELRTARHSSGILSPQSPDGVVGEGMGAAPPLGWSSRMLSLLANPTHHTAFFEVGEGDARTSKDDQRFHAYLKRITWVEEQRGAEQTWGTLTAGERVKAELANTMRRRATFHRTRPKTRGDEEEES
ncbi:unnamed protein product [Phytomonas sp. Hart1]|nr:unnamed protein product [Phytomonas sp. Hart1]|eukprot:CCW69346.1 unnamed protein product [Phytomonas sp. isolate Hart1]